MGNIRLYNHRMKRFLLRLLKIPNILVIIVIVVVFYLFKTYMHLKFDMAIIEIYRQRDFNRNFIPTSVRVRDWHDYALIAKEKKQKGVGEQGVTAHVAKSKANLERKLYKVNGYNGALSDMIALNRSLPDIRHRKCRNRLYIESLPTVSVVVPFHNEHLSTLLRTAYSVINRSPEHLIKEVILVDDASTKDTLKQELDEHLSVHLPKVRVLRLAERSGLITARRKGAEAATAHVLLFLDSHTEANVNWLPPLLEPIALNYRTAVCPFIDVIAYDTFEYRAQDEGARGAFDWEFFYKRLPVLPKDEANMPEPFESPVMAGGLFAISRAFFWELGGYDPELDIWGGEQYELSFKVWQCGGRLLDAPCSRVGHVYRKFAPFPNPNHGDFVGRNYRRVAEVWMDEYAEYLYKRRPHYRAIDTGDISQQLAVRKRLHCKSFHWFMTQIAFDLTAKYPPVEPKEFASGRIRPAMKESLCVDADNGQQGARVQLRGCSAHSTEQEFVFSWHKDIKIKQRGMCLDLSEHKGKSPVLLYPCHLGGGNQMWKYREESKSVVQPYSNCCLDWNPLSRELVANTCNGAVTQRWLVDTINHDMMLKWDETSVRVTGPVPM